MSVKIGFIEALCFINFMFPLVARFIPLYLFRDPRFIRQLHSLACMAPINPLFFLSALLLYGLSHFCLERQ